MTNDKLDMESDVVVKTSQFIYATDFLHMVVGKAVQDLIPLDKKKELYGKALSSLVKSGFKKADGVHLTAKEMARRENARATKTEPQRSAEDPFLVLRRTFN